MYYALLWYVYGHWQVVETVAFLAYATLAAWIWIVIIFFGVLYILASLPYSRLKLVIDLIGLILIALGIGLLWPVALATLLIATFWSQRREGQKWQLWPRAA